MSAKDLSKKFKRWLARVAFKTMIPLIGLMPLGMAYAFAKVMSRIVFFLIARHRKIAMQNLDIAFGPDKSKKEKAKIARECFEYMAKSGVEIVYLLKKQDSITSKVTIEGRKSLEEAFRKGNGVIAVSGHFGNFPLMMASLAREGFKVNVIMRYMRDQKIEGYFHKKREEMGVHTIHSTPRDVCVKKSLSVLRNNQMLFIPLDQHFGTGGIFVDFFNRKAATATGPAVLALRTKAAIVPIFIIRNTDDTHKIIIEPEICFEESGDYDKTVYDIISKITTIIEKYIRLYPSQWGWIHRRWKGQQDIGRSSE